MCAGKDTSGALTEAIKLFNKEHEADGLKVVEARAGRRRDRGPQPVHPARPGQVRRVRRPAVRHHLDRRVRPAGLAAGPQRLRERRARTSSSRPRCPPTTTTASSGACRRSPARACCTAAPTRSPDVPATWQELYAQGAEQRRLRLPGRAYEGLTCNFVELSSAAGGTILSEDGKKAEFDSPENLKALQLMVDGMKSGGAVKASRTYMEEPARIAFESGKATFMRNWSYAYALGKKAAEGQGQRRGHRRCRRSRAAARAACWAATARSSAPFTDNPRARCCGSTTGPRRRRSSATRRSTRCRRRMPPALRASRRVKKTLPYAEELLHGGRERDAAARLARLPADLRRRSTRTSTRRSPASRAPRTR